MNMIRYAKKNDKYIILVCFLCYLMLIYVFGQHSFLLALRFVSARLSRRCYLNLFLTPSRSAMTMRWTLCICLNTIFGNAYFNRGVRRNHKSCIFARNMRRLVPVSLHICRQHTHVHKCRTCNKCSYANTFYYRVALFVLELWVIYYVIKIALNTYVLRTYICSGSSYEEIF